MELEKIYHLIEYEKECLATWQKGKDLSILPDHWDVEKQEAYLDSLYVQFYEEWLKNK